MYKSKKTGSVCGARACGSCVLVELLTAQETLGTQLTLQSDSKVEAPQAYILDIGPGIDREKWGFAVGDRVIFSGGFVPAPKFDNCERHRGTIDPHSIKCVLTEEVISRG